MNPYPHSNPSNDGPSAQAVVAHLRTLRVEVKVVDLPGQEPRIRLVPPSEYVIPTEIAEAVTHHTAEILHILQERRNLRQSPVPIRPDVSPDEEFSELSSLPPIDAGNLKLPDVTAQAWEALGVANDPPYLFIHGGALFRCERNDSDRPTLVLLTRARLRYTLARVATWYREKDGNILDALPPLHVVEDMLATPHMPIPILKRIVEVPTFTAAGSLIVTPGYDAVSGIYYAPVKGLSLAEIRVSPTPDDIATALGIIDDLLMDFPFVGDEGKPYAERANALALPLEIIAREMIDGPMPLHIFEAPSAGTGKSLMADVLTLPVIGEQVAILAKCRDDDEWRKRFSSLFRTLTPVILIDNVRRPLDSGVLAAALTAPSWEDRLLGTNDVLRVPIHNAWVATANNPTLSTEIARRVVRTRLDPKVDRPWQRKGFRHQDLRKRVKEHRSEIIWAFLTLVQSWIANGKQAGTATLGSYERWAAVIGGILENAGIAGFLENQQALLEEADTEGEVWRQFVTLWWEEHESAEVSAADLFEIAKTVEGFTFGRGDERAQTSSFGKQLAQQRDRVFGTYRVVFVRTVKRIKRWQLVVGLPALHDDETNGALPPSTHAPPVSDATQGESESSVQVGVGFRHDLESSPNAPVVTSNRESVPEPAPSCTIVPLSSGIAANIVGVDCTDDMHHVRDTEQALVQDTLLDVASDATKADIPTGRMRVRI